MQSALHIGIVFKRQTLNSSFFVLLHLQIPPETINSDGDLLYVVELREAKLIIVELDDSRFELQSIERNYSWTIYHYARSQRKCHSTDSWNLLHSSNNTPEWPTFKPRREQMEVKCSLLKTLPSHGEFISNIWNTHQSNCSQRGHLRWHSHEWEDIFIVIW